MTSLLEGIFDSLNFFTIYSELEEKFFEISGGCGLDTLLCGSSIGCFKSQSLIEGF